jgi:hypothetical protein
LHKKEPAMTRITSTEKLQPPYKTNDLAYQATAGQHMRETMSAGYGEKEAAKLFKHE